MKFCHVMLLNVNPVAGYSAQGGTPHPAQWVHCWRRTGAAVMFWMWKFLNTAAVSQLYRTDGIVLGWCYLQTLRTKPVPLPPP